MSTENYEDQRELWKELRHDMHYGLGTQVHSTMFSMLESSMRSKFITTGGLRYGRNSMRGIMHSSRYSELKYQHIFNIGINNPAITNLWLAKVQADAKRFLISMRSNQRLPVTFFNGGFL